jgi:hypothetical protein
MKHISIKLSDMKSFQIPFRGLELLNAEKQIDTQTK